MKEAIDKIDILQDATDLGISTQEENDNFILWKNTGSCLTGLILGRHRTSVGQLS